MNFEYSVKTASGKEFEIRFMGATVVGITSILYIEFIGKTMMELMPVFSDEQETSHIYGLVNGNVEKEYRGYTNLIEFIVLADTKNIRIALTAPIDALGA